MKRFIISILILFVAATNVFSQISENDIQVNIIGLSDEYAQKFRKASSIAAFVDVWNRLVQYETSKIIVDITYKDNKGWIDVSIPYNPITHFNSNKYSRHNDQFVSMGADGVSVFLQNDIFTAITEYKFEVAREGWTIDNRIMNFTNVVSLVKSNGDILLLSGYNHRNSRTGAYPFRFYTNAELKVNGKFIQVLATNVKMLNELNFFCWGPLVGMDGKKSAAYYMAEFFKPSEKEKAAYEAEQKAIAEREARLQEERLRRKNLAEKICIDSIQEQIASGKTMSLYLLIHNKCKIEDNGIWYNDGDLNFQIGKIYEPTIKYIGGKEHFNELLSICGPKGTLSFSTHNNQAQEQTITNLFSFRAKCASIGLPEKASYFFDSDFPVETYFNISDSKQYPGIKIKVAEKKGEFQYNISLPWDESTSPTYLHKEELLEHLKQFLLKKGLYKFNLQTIDGSFSITSRGEKISSDIPTTKIILVKDVKDSSESTEYYVFD